MWPLGLQLEIYGSQTRLQNKSKVTPISLQGTNPIENLFRIQSSLNNQRITWCVLTKTITKTTSASVGH